jgi:hypothetical protein
MANPRDERDQPSEIGKFSDLEPPFAERQQREIIVVYAEVELFEVLGADLDKFIEQGANSGTSLTLASTCLSVAITICITLATLAMSATQTALWTGVGSGLGIGGLGFGIFWLRTTNSLRQTVTKIKSRRTGRSGGVVQSSSGQ